MGKKYKKHTKETQEPTRKHVCEKQTKEVGETHGMVVWYIPSTNATEGDWIQVYKSEEKKT